MAVFVLRLREGLNTIPEGHVEELRQLPGTQIVDVLSRMVLVNSCRNNLEEFVSRNEKIWSLKEGESPSRTNYTLPTQRRSVGQRAGSRETDEDLP